MSIYLNFLKSFCDKNKYVEKKRKQKAYHIKNVNVALKEKQTKQKKHETKQTNIQKINYHEESDLVVCCFFFLYSMLIFRFVWEQSVDKLNVYHEKGTENCRYDLRHLGQQIFCFEKLFQCITNA